MNHNIIDDPIYGYLGLICVVKLSEKSFAARLIDVRGDGDQAELWFESKKGIRFMVQRRDALRLWLAKDQVPREAA